MKAMILAAGKGTRLKPITDTIPKPLVKVGDHALIEYHLHALHRAGFREVVINIADHVQLIMDFLGDGKRFGLSITYSFESEGPFGTGGGLQHALPLLGNAPFLLVSGDIYTDYNFANFLNKSFHKPLHCVLVANPEYNSKGDFGLSANADLTLTPPKYTYGNIALIDPKLFFNVKPGNFPLAPIFETAIKNNAATGEIYEGLWHNVGTIEELDKAKKAKV